MDSGERKRFERQWNEKALRPLATRPMNKAEIEEYRKILVMSYQCDDGDITVDFEKISDDQDRDRNDCLWLIYKLKCIWYGKPTRREIARLKLPIPDEIKIMAEKMKRESKPEVAALPAPMATPMAEAPKVRVPQRRVK